MCLKTVFSAFEALFTMFIGMSQLFMHGIQGLIRGEIVGEDRRTGGLPSKLREEKIGMSSLATAITLSLPQAKHSITLPV